MQINLTAVFQKVPLGYIGFVQELPGANTQGATLEETRTNLQEAIFLVLEANRILAEESLAGQIVIREPLFAIAAGNGAILFASLKSTAANFYVKAVLTLFTLTVLPKKQPLFRDIGRLTNFWLARSVEIWISRNHRKI